MMSHMIELLAAGRFLTASFKWVCSYKGPLKKSKF